ncbi:hypothetical protein [Streptomyces blastmyceticus]|uniref:Uncharacterized protein n=1 Tax=Streptomyces blastmyceticus TaxID=68180 RepID=A0ABN0XMN4_9ACTN
MAKSKSSRFVKGAVVSAAAAHTTYWIWASARHWASDVGEARSDSFFGGFLESALATAAGVTVMPVLLWAGMRALRERGNHLLVAMGSLMWLFAGAYVVEKDVGMMGTEVLLVLFILFCGLLALVTEGRERARPPG